jgi:protein-tyrosine phosphatase
MERELDLNVHRARVLSREIVTGADLILVMGPHHLERAQVLGGEGRSHLLTAYASRDHSAEAVADPFGGDLDQYRETFADLERTVGLAFDRLAAERGAGDR